ncbi:MAG: hypothetical protein OHK0039_21910 [Bacteroidia bacterium]
MSHQSLSLHDCQSFLALLREQDFPAEATRQFMDRVHDTLMLYPDDPDLTCILAELLFHDDHVEEALISLRRLLLDDLVRVDAWGVLGLGLLCCGDEPMGWSCLCMAVSVNDLRQEGYWWDMLHKHCPLLHEAVDGDLEAFLRDAIGLAYEILDPGWEDLPFEICCCQP